MDKSLLNINTSINNLDNQTTKINKLELKNIWTGTAASNLTSKLDEITKKIKKEKENLTKFQEALTLVDECKKLDQQIIKLKNSILTVTNEQNRQQIEAENARINNEISIKNTKKEDLKKIIKSIISTFGVSTNTLSTVIPSGLSGNLKYKYTYGAIYEFKNENGKTFEAYIPNNYNSNTKIMIYEAGDGRNSNEINNPKNWESFKNKFEKESCNAIVLRATRSNAVKYYNQLVNECNLDNPQPITVSHSGGTIYSMKETNELINQSSTNKPAIVTILDGYAPADHLEKLGVIDNLKENNSIVLAFSQKKGNTDYEREYKNLAKKGVNVLIFYDESEYGQSHGGVNKSFTEANIMEYILGEGKLSDNYKIKKYDMNNKEFIEVNLSQIPNIQSTYNLFN